MPEFHNPYHFVPVENTNDSNHRLSVEYFNKAELGHYSHAAYHEGKYSGRIICRLTTTDNLMFVGAERENDTQNDKHFELEKDKPAIPATTLRGLLSSLAETASNSALRVLNDQMLSYRQEMRKSLSAIGMVRIEKNEIGETVYKLLPLSMPTLKETHNGLFTFVSENNNEKLAYQEMFPEPRFKIYIDYGNNDALQSPHNSKTTFAFGISTETYFKQVIKHSFVDGYYIKNHISLRKPTRNNNLIIGQVTYKSIADEIKGMYSTEKMPFIYRILGKYGRDMPKEKKHECLIPYYEKPDKKDTFIILPEAIERFEQLADECTKLLENKAEREGRVFEEMTPTEKENWLFSLMPYHLKGTERNSDRSEFGNKLRIKDGDLVYFRPTMQDNQAVVAEIAFSSIWRGRVEDEQGQKASVHRFFADIDPELLPFNEKRTSISPAELLFGFVENRDEEQKNRQQKAGKAFAGRVQVSFGQIDPNKSGDYYDDNPVTLKILATPKLPCPSMYFRNRYTNATHIKKAKLKPEDHKPQGRKMYLHRYKNGSKRPWKTEKPDKDVKQKTTIQPVKKGTEFFFHIDFNNLNEWELGMLCYALRPTEEFRHKLGMGKSIGLGTVCIAPVGLFLIDREKRYATDDIFNNQRYHNAWVDNQVQLPQDFYSQEIKAQDLDNLPFTWQYLRNKFRETMSIKVRQALELLGNPNKVTQQVHTPQVADQSLETETFNWFVENEKNHRQSYLKPLDKAENSELPTLPLWRKTR